MFENYCAQRDTVAKNPNKQTVPITNAHKLSTEGKKIPFPKKSV